MFCCVLCCLFVLFCYVRVGCFVLLVVCVFALGWLDLVCFVLFCFVVLFVG